MGLFHIGLVALTCCMASCVGGGGIAATSAQDGTPSKTAVWEGISRLDSAVLHSGHWTIRTQTQFAPRPGLLPEDIENQVKARRQAMEKAAQEDPCHAPSPEQMDLMEAQFREILEKIRRGSIVTDGLELWYVGRDLRVVFPLRGAGKGYVSNSQGSAEWTLSQSESAPGTLTLAPPGKLPSPRDADARVPASWWGVGLTKLTEETDFVVLNRLSDGQVEVSGRVRNSDRTFEAWLDPDRDWLATRFKLYAGDGALLEEVLVDDASFVAGVGWLPTQARQTLYDPEPPHRLLVEKTVSASYGRASGTDVALPQLSHMSATVVLEDDSVVSVDFSGSPVPDMPTIFARAHAVAEEERRIAAESERLGKAKAAHRP